MSDDLRDFRSRIDGLATSLYGVTDVISDTTPTLAESPLTAGEIEQLRWRGEYRGDMPYPRPATPTHTCTSNASVYRSPSSSHSALVQVPAGTELAVINEGTGDGCAWSHVIIATDSSFQRGYIQNDKISKLSGQLPSLGMDCNTPQSQPSSSSLSPPWLQKAANEVYFDTSSATHRVTIEGAPDLISASTEGLADCLVDATFRGATLILESLGKKSEKEFVFSLLKDYFISFQVADYNLSSRPGGPLKILVEISHKYLPAIENGIAAASIDAQDGGLYGYGGVAFYKMFETRDLISFIDRSAEVIDSYQPQLDNFEGQTRGFTPAQSATALREFSAQLVSALQAQNIQPTQEGSIELGWGPDRQLVMFLANTEAGPNTINLSPFQSESFTPTVMNYIMLSSTISHINTEEVGWVDFMTSFSLDAGASIQAISSEDTAPDSVDETQINNLREEADQVPVKTLSRTIEENRVFDSNAFRQEAQRVVRGIYEDVGGVQSRLSDILSGINSVEESYDLLLNRVSVDGLLAEALSCIAKQVPDYNEFADAVDSAAREGFSKGRQLVGAAREGFSKGQQLVGAAAAAAGSIPRPNQDFFDAIPQMPTVPTLDFPDELPTNDLLEDYVEGISAAILEAVTSAFVEGIKSILENVMASCDILDDTQAAITSTTPTDPQIDRVRNELSRQGLDDSSLNLFSFFDDVSNLLTSREVCSLFTGNASVSTINLVTGLMVRKHNSIAVHLGKKGRLNKETKAFFKSVGEILGTGSFCKDLDSAFDSGDINDFCGDSNLYGFRQELLREKCILTEEEIRQQLTREKERKLNTAKKLADLLANGMSVRHSLSCKAPGSQIVPASHHTFDFMLEQTVDNLFAGVYSTFSSDIKDYGPTLVSSVEKFSSDEEHKLQGIDRQALPSFRDSLKSLNGTVPFNNYRNQGYGSAINVRTRYEAVPGFASEANYGGGLSISDTTAPKDFSIGYILQPSLAENSRRYKVFILSGEDTLFHKEFVPTESDAIAEYLNAHILTLDYLDERDNLLSLQQYSFSKLLLNSMNADNILKPDADRTALVNLFSHGAYAHSAAQVFSSLSHQILQSPLFRKLELPYSSPPSSDSSAIENIPLLIEYLDFSCISSLSCKEDNVLNLENAKSMAKAGFCEVAPPTNPDEIFSPFDKTMLESIIKATIRIYTFDYFMRGFFVFSAIYSKSSSASTDSSLAELYLDKMMEEMVEMDSGYHSRFVSTSVEIFMKDTTDGSPPTKDMLDDLHERVFVPEIKQQLDSIRTHVSKIIKFDTMKEVDEAFLDGLNLYDAPSHKASGVYHSRGYDRFSRLNWDQNKTRVRGEIISALNTVLADPSIISPSESTITIPGTGTGFGGIGGGSGHTLEIPAPLNDEDVWKDLADKGYWDPTDSAQAAFVWEALSGNELEVPLIRLESDTMNEATRSSLRLALGSNFDKYMKLEDANRQVDVLLAELAQQQVHLRSVENHLAAMGLDSEDATGDVKRWHTDVQESIASLLKQIQDTQRLAREPSSGNTQDLKNGGLLLEQFIRVTDWTADEDEYRFVPEEVKRRPSHLRGVLSRQVFTQLLDMIILANANLKDSPLSPNTNSAIAPLFKDVQYGLRLVYVPPALGERDASVVSAVSETPHALGQVLYPHIPVVSPPTINLDPEISEDELLAEETEDFLSIPLAPPLLASEPSAPLYTLDLATEWRGDPAFYKFAEEEKLYYIREVREYVPTSGTTPIVETIVLRPLRLVEINHKLTDTPGELLAKTNLGFVQVMPILYQKILENDTYKFLTQLIFPLGLYENLLNFTNFVSASETPGMKEVFSTTKEQIKYAFDATAATGDLSYQQQDGSIRAAGGIAGVKEKMASLTGVLESPNQEKLQNIKGVGMGYIAKAALRAPLQIIKGQAELVDPNIRISKRIQRKIKERGRDVPIGSISFPLSLFIPPTPFGIAYLGLGLGGFDSGPKDVASTETPTEEKTEMQLELEDKGVSIAPSSCIDKKLPTVSPAIAAMESEIFVSLSTLEETEE